MSDLSDRIRRGWNAFVGRDQSYQYSGPGYGYRPDRTILKTYNSRSVMGSIYNRIAVDVASLTFNHARVDDDDRFKEVIRGPLNDVLTISANKDQTSMAFILDAVMTMFDEGTVALVPIDTKGDPTKTDSYTIQSIRVGRIKTWYPDDVRVEVYNDRCGIKMERTFPKSIVAIVENPFYSIMNEPNSLLQRLLKLLNQIDQTNAQASSGKLDLIMQLPYVIKTQARKSEAEQRLKSIEDQLRSGPYGIAYIDGTEKITQLNRSVENNLWAQAKDLQDQLYNQLGLTKSIFDGTADEATVINYYSRTIEVIAKALTLEMSRKWLSKTARTQKQTVWFYRDPFKLVPINQIAEVADKFTRNEILSSNEIRSIVGRRPSEDPKADQLINSNLNQAKEGGILSGLGNQSVLNLSKNSSFIMDASRIQNAQTWLNQIGTQSIRISDDTSRKA